jgi:hypothetical protein
VVTAAVQAPSVETQNTHRKVTTASAAAARAAAPIAIAGFLPCAAGSSLGAPHKEKEERGGDWTGITPPSVTVA